MKGEVMKASFSKILAGVAAALTLTVGGVAAFGIDDSTTEQARHHFCRLDPTTPYCP